MRQGVWSLWVLGVSVSLLMLVCRLVHAQTPLQSVTLAWDAPVDIPADLPLQGYRVLRRGSSTAPSTIVCAVPATVRTCADTLMVADTYTYMAVADYGTAGLSVPSNAIQVVVPAVALLAVPDALHRQGTAPPGPYPLLPHGMVKVHAVDSEELPGYAKELAVDDNVTTFWHSQWRTASPPLPHSLTLDLRTPMWVDGFRYLGRQDGVLNGMITMGRLEVSTDLQTWTQVAPVMWAADAPAKIVQFPATLARYVRLVATKSAGIRLDTWAHAVEVGIFAVAGP